MGKRARDKEWREDCIKYRGVVLKGKKSHWCWDWDGLPVDETTKEYECCSCIFVVRRGETRG